MWKAFKPTWNLCIPVSPSHPDLPLVHIYRPHTKNGERWCFYKCLSFCWRGVCLWRKGGLPLEWGLHGGGSTWGGGGQTPLLAKIQSIGSRYASSWNAYLYLLFIMHRPPLPAQIRSIGGRYASYWNAYLYLLFIMHSPTFSNLHQHYVSNSTDIYLCLGSEYFYYYFGSESQDFSVCCSIFINRNKVWQCYWIVVLLIITCTSGRQGFLTHCRGITSSRLYV